MKITALVEERARVAGLATEHGLSLILEKDGESWLFDTGQSGIAAENAARLGIDLGGIRGVVLSHGHYDHTGGLDAVLEAAGPKRVFGHPGIFRPRYSLKKKGKSRRIGLPESRAALEGKGAEFSLSREWREIADGIYLSGEIPLSPGSAPAEPFLTVRDKLKLKPDLFVDEQFLLVESPEGLVMLNGCCHTGLIDSLRHARSCRPGAKIRAIVGGLHLRSAGSAELKKISEALEEYDPELIAAGHCTGKKAEEMLAEKFGRRFQSLRAGLELEL